MTFGFANCAGGLGWHGISVHADISLAQAWVREQGSRFSRQVISPRFSFVEFLEAALGFFLRPSFEYDDPEQEICLLKLLSSTSTKPSTQG